MICSYWLPTGAGGANRICDESTIGEVIGTNNLDYGLCEFYRGVIAYTRSQPVIAEQHLLNADAVFHDVMNENPDNNYSKSTARYLYSLYMRWGKPELLLVTLNRIYYHNPILLIESITCACNHWFDSVFLLHLHCELQKEAYHMNLFPSWLVK